MDVNLSPDKRQLLLHWERAVVMKVKAALLAALGCGDESQSMPMLPGAASPIPNARPPLTSAKSSSNMESENLTQQPLISAHLISSSSSSANTAVTTSASQSDSPSFLPSDAKRPRFSSPQPSSIASQKPIFASESARRNYNKRLVGMSSLIHLIFSLLS